MTPKIIEIILRGKYYFNYSVYVLFKKTENFWSDDFHRWPFLIFQKRTLTPGNSRNFAEHYSEMYCL